MIVLVHGYNVSEEGAEEAYTKFQDNFYKYCSPLYSLKDAIYWFFCPSKNLTWREIPKRQITKPRFRI